MNYKIAIKRIDTVNDVEGYWSDDDLIQLLDKFNYPDGATAEKNEDYIKQNKDSIELWSKK